MSRGINAIFESLSEGSDLRASLLELKKILKEDDGSKADESRISILKKLLEDKDPKVRQNAAFCLGEFKAQDCLQVLFESYKKDSIKYNKAVYIEALSKLDLSPVAGELAGIAENIRNSEIAAEDRKHVIGEMRALNVALRPYFHTVHEFTGFDLVNEAVLLTNRNFKDITCKELGTIPHKEFSAGVMIKTRHLEKVLDIRTYSELLFVPASQMELTADPYEAARVICEHGIVEYLRERHSNGDAPFYFRVEYKTKTKDSGNKSDFEKSLAGALELESKWALINSVDDYETEFRIIEGSDGKLKLLIGMRTLPDKRFLYRKETISTGIKPYLAALLIRLSADQIRDNACVMDLMCGSGILLIERNAFKPARLLYGVDIYGPAVKAAHANIKAAGLEKKTELITRDISDFKHEHKVDEIYADTPMVTSSWPEEKLQKLFETFFRKADELLDIDGYVFVYTHNKDLFKTTAAKRGFCLIRSFEISKVEKSWYFVFNRSKM
ncbi:MAG: methyltransferase [Lachnospiraceae bacterium]|nr:methyltransferase [Lachnospiraceae bacterium]